MASRLTRTERKATRRRDRELLAAAKKASLLSRGVQITLYVLSLFGVGFFVAIAEAKPHVQLEHLDSKDPFLFPFRVVNDSFVTFYQVSPVSFADAPNAAEFSDSSSFASVEPGTHLALGFRQRGETVDISPGRSHGFSFSNVHVSESPRVPDDLRLRLSIDYSIRLLPLLRLSFCFWREHMVLNYHVLKDSNGTPYWVED